MTDSIHDLSFLSYHFLRFQEKTRTFEKKPTSGSKPHAISNKKPSKRAHKRG